MSVQPAEGMMAIRPVRYIFVAAFTFLAILALVALIVWGVFGPLAALLVFSAGLLVAGIYHVRNLHKLVSWLRTPVDDSPPMPRAIGMWDYIFADVNSRARSANRRQQRLSSALERFREASQAMPHGLLFLSNTHTIEWVNRQGEQHFGLEQARDQGMPITNLVRQPDGTIAFVVDFAGTDMRNLPENTPVTSQASIGDNGEIVEKILFGLNKKGITLILVTHDPDLAKKCQRQIMIKDGKIVAKL